ncbi:MAG: S41 family peptidase [Bacillota bacterium]|nr:S41 family peptidase [Bacillota bacterium]
MRWPSKSAVVILLLLWVWILSIPAGAQTPPADPGEARLLEVYRLLLKEYAGPGSPLKPEELSDAAIRALLRTLGDSYTVYFSPDEAQYFVDSLSGEYEGVGIVLILTEKGPQVQSLVEGGPAERAGLHPGDLLVRVDDRDLKDLPLEIVGGLLRGEAGTRVTVTYEREGQRHTVGLTRARLEMPSVEVKSLGDGIFLMRIDQFNENTGTMFQRQLQRLKERGLRGLILDVRNNPGGYVDAAVEVAGSLLPGGPVVYMQDAKGELTPLSHPSSGRPIPVSVLINGGSASAAEIVAGALQDAGAPLYGERTFGKGTVQRLEPLTGDAYLKITVAHYLTPSGRLIDGQGLMPDVGEEDLPKEYPFSDLPASAEYGQKGPGILAVQEALRLLGYPVNDPAGTVGDSTLHALSLFAWDRHLTSAEVLPALQKARDEHFDEVTGDDPWLKAAFYRLLQGQPALKWPAALRAGD